MGWVHENRAKEVGVWLQRISWVAEFARRDVVQRGREKLKGDKGASKGVLANGREHFVAGGAKKNGRIKKQL